MIMALATATPFVLFAVGGFMVWILTRRDRDT